jgi:hypothetical protein
MPTLLEHVAGEIARLRAARDVFHVPGQTFDQMMARLRAIEAEPTAPLRCDWLNCTAPAVVIDDPHANRWTPLNLDERDVWCLAHHEAEHCEGYVHADCDGIATRGWPHDCDAQPHDDGQRCTTVLWWCADCASAWGVPVFVHPEPLQVVS